MSNHRHTKMQLLAQASPSDLRSEAGMSRALLHFYNNNKINNYNVHHKIEPSVILPLEVDGARGVGAPYLANWTCDRGVSYIRLGAPKATKSALLRTASFCLGISSVSKPRYVIHDHSLSERSAKSCARRTQETAYTIHVTRRQRPRQSPSRE
jgi:hypothetical protein